jgi:hypothetical protein
MTPSHIRIYFTPLDRDPKYKRVYQTQRKVNQVEYTNSKLGTNEEVCQG